MEWKIVTRKEDNSIQIPSRWLYLHYYEALNILFRIENSLRIFVYTVLKNEYKEKWLEIKITSDDADEGAISSIAKKRMAQARNFGYLGYSSPCPIMYLTSGELTRLITSDGYWKHFNGYFLASRDIIKSKLDEIGVVRYSHAHFRPIKSDDIELLKQNAKHVFIEIENCIADLIGRKNIVPTNTSEDWYKELRALGSDICNLSFHQSSNEKWIRIEMSYKCPIISKQQEGATGEYIWCKALNILSPAILKIYPPLTNLVTYLSENVYGSVPGKGEIDIRKIISLVFGRDILAKQYEILKEQIGKILVQIKNETDLILEDNLAAGKLIDSISVSARLRKVDGNSYWSVNTLPLFCKYKEDDPPEYWGEIDWFVSDFVAATHRYPWMPTTISEYEYPF